MKIFIVEIVFHDQKTLRSFLVSHIFIQYGSVPLEMAAGKGHIETVQILLETGANVNYQNKVITANVVVTQQQQIRRFLLVVA